MVPENAKHFERTQKAAALMELGRYVEALSELSNVLVVDSEDYSALCMKAACHFKLKEFQDGYDTTKLAIAAWPDHEWAYRIQSLIFTANGEAPRALDAAREAVRRMPDSFETNHTLFYAQVAYGSLDEARQTLATVLKLAPDGKTAHIARGHLALNEKQYAEAENAFTEALRLDPESTEALNNLGVVYSQMASASRSEKYRQMSLEMFERAVRSEPTFKLGQNNIRLARQAPNLKQRRGVRWLGLACLFFLFSAVPQTLLYNGFNGEVDAHTTLGDIFSPISEHLGLMVLNFASILLYPVSVGIGLVYGRFFDGTGKAALLNNIRNWRVVLYCSAAVSLVYFVLIIVNFSDINSFPGIGLRMWLVVLLISAVNVFHLRQISEVDG